MLNAGHIHGMLDMVHNPLHPRSWKRVQLILQCIPSFYLIRIRWRLNELILHPHLLFKGGAFQNSDEVIVQKTRVYAHADNSPAIRNSTNHLIGNISFV